jgi:hypothetical protein
MEGSERFPDGRGLIHQPVRLLRGLDIVGRYFDEQEPQE